MDGEASVVQNEEKYDELALEEIKSTSKAFGPIEEVVVDQRGRIISGEHRLRIDPNWPRKVTHVETEEDYLRKRLLAGVVRRTKWLPKDETALNDLAKLYVKEGVKPGSIVQEIATRTGLSRWTIQRHLNEEHKDRNQARRRAKQNGKRDSGEQPAHRTGNDHLVTEQQKEPRNLSDARRVWNEFENRLREHVGDVPTSLKYLLRELTLETLVLPKEQRERLGQILRMLGDRLEV